MVYHVWGIHSICVAEFAGWETGSVRRLPQPVSCLVIRYQQNKLYKLICIHFHNS